MKSKILIVMAHADDELIFGWPILQDKNIEKEVLICSSDLNNSKRKWCSHRKEVLFSICKELNINCHCLDYNSAFYKINARDESLKRLCLDIKDNINSFNFDYIFTHNPMGEYGMLDHILINHIVMSMNVKMLFTDTYLVNNWSHYNEIPEKFKKIYFQNKIRNCKLNMSFYNRIKNFYVKSKVWTWNQEPIKQCGLYEL